MPGLARSCPAVSAVILSRTVPPLVIISALYLLVNTIALMKVSINSINNTLLISLLSELRTCSITQDNCEVTYQVGVYILGTEGSIMVVFDETQSDINDWSGKK